MKEIPKVSVILLNYNNQKDTIECFESVRAITYKNYNVDDLTCKINKYVNDSKLLIEISEKTLQTIDRCYSWDDIADKYLKILNTN